MPTSIPMTTEIQMLGFSLILGLIQLFMSAGASNMQRGSQWVASARDSAAPPLTGIYGRVDRAFQNFKETFPFFLGAVLLVTITNTSSPISAAGAQIYFFARLVYVALYLSGIPFIRSLVWLASIAGIGMIIGTWIL